MTVMTLKDLRDYPADMFTTVFVGSSRTRVIDGRSYILILADVKKGKAGPIPRELQNVHADGAGFEREQGYLYPHDYPGHWVRQQYLPDNLAGSVYYEAGDNKFEQATKQYWEKIKG